MPVKSKKQPTMVGLSSRQMRKKPIGADHLLDIKPLTPSQEKVYEAWQSNKHLFLFGAAGTGKSFITLYLALKSILDESTPYNKLYIVRSLVPLERSVSYLATMRTRQTYIKYHTRIWYVICLRCLMMHHLRCYMAT